MYEKLSTYISSVAGPFHPFGGAVDIIVVQQQDGSFKSTPWYVRFGKFQGVLKRSEEIVTVAVNGVEAGFHMHLVDNTGQAYLLREVESDEKEDDEKSDSSVDEAVSASRRESFKSAESRGEVEEQDIDIIDDHGDDEEEANGIRASLELDSLDSISMVRQRNGDILISFGERSPKFSDMQTRNGLVDASSKYSPNRTYKSKARESNSEMELDKRVNLALSPSGNVSTEQNYCASIVQEELANGNEIQSVHSHLGLQSSTVQNVDTAFLKIDTVGQSEYLGRAPNSKWDSYKEASVFTMEESSGISIVSATNTSGTDDFVLSRYSAYDYEHMDLPQSEDALDARKDEDVNSEVVLMSVDGYLMTAPISSFKHSENVGLCGHQMKTVLIHDVDSHSEDKFVHSGEVENSSIEYGTDNHDLEHTEIINSSDTLVEGAATWKPEGIMQTQCGFSVSEIFLDSEVDSKQTGKLSDSIDNQVHNGIEGHLKTKVDAHDMPRTESEIEFNFNDEDIFKSCLALSELSPPIGEEEGQNSLSPHLEEEEEYDGGTSLSDGIQTESSLAASQLGTPQVLHAESSHISDHMDNCNFEHLSGSMSDCPRKESNPINIPGLHIKGRGAHGQVGRSLPNMGFASSSLETSVSEHVFSHSFDSSFYKRTSTNDMLTSSFGNMEPNGFKEEYIRAAETSELYKLNDKDTSNKSLETDVVTDVEISLCGDLLKKGMGTEAAAQAFDSKRVLREAFMCSGAEIVKNEKLIVRIGGQYYPWSAVAHVILGKFAFNLESPAELEGKISVEHIETEAVRDNTSESNVSSSGRWRLWPFPFRRLRTPDKSPSEKLASKVELVADLEAASQNASEKESESKNPSSSPPQKCKLRMDTPTSEQLASLNLKEGQNMITFTILTSIWGKQQVDARIYLWKWNTRIVISDVDGTITKSDVLGQVMPLVGKDWTQIGVARLFSAIKDNGYQLLFLSARAIVQAYLTRQFLLNLKQDGEALPDGPVLISPDGLFPSLYREVIRRAPHEFKIACLENIRRLFPPDCNPFYAGFGNRDTDEISYLKVGIPKGKIFIINPKGVVVVNHCVEVKSYTSLHKLADDMFPPMPSCEREDFNSWNYWKLPVPDIED